MARSSLLSPGGSELPRKKAHGSFLGVSFRYVCGAAYSLCGFLLLLSLFLNSKCDFLMLGAVPRVPGSLVGLSFTRCLPST
jgi:hypothetical protein